MVLWTKEEPKRTGWYGVKLEVDANKRVTKCQLALVLDVGKVKGPAGIEVKRVRWAQGVPLSERNLLVDGAVTGAFWLPIDPANLVPVKEEPSEHAPRVRETVPYKRG